jgi:glycolate oxidase FAD binding subunit
VLDGDADPAAAAQFVAGLRASLDGAGPDGASLGQSTGREFADGEAPPSRASVVVVTAPAAVRDRVDIWGPVPSPGLMRAVKEQFDPGYLMAPGRFAGGL